MKYVRPDAWPAERRARLLVLIDAGLSAKEAGVQLGMTRNAILGYAHRQGLKFPVTAEKMARTKVGRPKKEKTKGFKPQKFPEGHPARSSRPFGARAFSDDKIAVAIAARMAGASRPKAAAIIGAGEQILSRWEKIPELAALGRELFVRAKADAAERAARARAVVAFNEAATRVTIERTNWPILGRMPERHRSICEALIAGGTLQSVGNLHGVTRERIRQISARWRIEGLVIPRQRPLSERTIAAFKAKDRPKRARLIRSAAHQQWEARI